MDKIVQYKSFDGRIYSNEKDCLDADKQYLKNKKYNAELDAITVRINPQWDHDLFRKDHALVVVQILKDKNRYEDMIKALNEIEEHNKSLGIK
jgi:hypothetical protein